MMPTSDERREVAARLRELAHDNQGALGAVRMRHVMDEGTRILGTVGLPDCAHVLTRYADLIDPTCHRERKRVVVDNYRRDTLILPVCSACGFTFDKRMPKPNFCPHCGARLVERGER